MLVGLSSLEQPQPPAQPKVIFGLSHFAKVDQPCFSQNTESEEKTEFAVFGNTFLKTTTALQLTKTAITVSYTHLTLPTILRV